MGWVSDYQVKVFGSNSEGEGEGEVRVSRAGDLGLGSICFNDRREGGWVSPYRAIGSGAGARGAGC